MKKYLVLLLAAGIAITGMAQGNSHNKGKDKMKPKSVKVKKDKEDKENKEYKEDKMKHGIWDGTTYVKDYKPSKNQPAKVAAAFMRDYPNASNVVWSKYKGDWTATFNNNPLGWGRAVAVYHANGDRRDTRIKIKRSQLPNPTIWNNIFVRDNVTPVTIIQVQSPTLASEIFRVTSQVLGLAPKYYFYDNSGRLIQYDY